MAIEPPCSVVCRFSKGECRYARANRTQPNDYKYRTHVSGEGLQNRIDNNTQMSTFSSRVVPVFTSNSSGARYAIVLCSAAVSCCVKACERFSIGIRAFMQLPKSIRIGVAPSSAIIMFLPVR
jgi:hypothetical protein